jgi:hypothetical protein
MKTIKDKVNELRKSLRGFERYGGGRKKGAVCLLGIRKIKAPQTSGGPLVV